MTEVFLACVAAAQANPSCDDEESCKSCSTNEDEHEVHWLTPEGEQVPASHDVSQLVERAVLLDWT